MINGGIMYKLAKIFEINEKKITKKRKKKWVYNFGLRHEVKKRKIHRRNPPISDIRYM